MARTAGDFRFTIVKRQEKAARVNTVMPSMLEPIVCNACTQSRNEERRNTCDSICDNRLTTLILQSICGERDSRTQDDTALLNLNGVNTTEWRLEVSNV